MNHFASRFDENKDGVITREESRSANDKMFDSIDANKDGKITKEERKAFGDKKRAEFQAKRAEIVAKLLLCLYIRALPYIKLFDQRVFRNCQKLPIYSTKYK